MKSNNYQLPLLLRVFGAAVLMVYFTTQHSNAQQLQKVKGNQLNQRVLHNGKAANSQGYYDGVIRIKLNAEVTSQLDQMLAQKASGKGEVIATQVGEFVTTGLSNLDAVHRGCQAKVMKRVFRPAGKFEARHRKHGLHLWYEVQYDDPRQIEQILQDYRGVAEVSLAEKVHERMHTGYEAARVYKAEEVLTDPPNDPFFDLNQYSYNNTGQDIQGQIGTPGADVSMFEAWEVETGSSDIIVAVTDGGIEVDHEDIIGHMWVNEDEIPGNGIDDDSNGYIDDINGYGFGDDTGAIPADLHGTHVGGTVAAETNNGLGVAGVAGGSGTDDGVRLMSLAAFGAVSQGGFEDTYTYGADNGAIISQNSWGYTFPGVFDQAVLDGIDYFIAEAGFDELGNPVGPMQGGIVIFAAGNSDADDDWWPGIYEPVMAVGGTDNQDGRYTSSNFGTWVDISAPAVDIASTGDGGEYFFLTGTSMACPHVSGAAALILSNVSRNGSTITPTELWDALVDNTDNIDATIPGFVGLLGSGRLNVSAALNSISTGPCTVAVPSGLLATNITENAADISWDSQASATSYDYRYRATGSATWTTVNTAATSASLSGLDPLTDYEFQVSAICPDETSAFSASTNFTTLDVAAPCSVDVPTGLTASGITDSSADLSWDSQADATSYDYQYRATGAATWTVVNTSNTSATVSGLDASTEYEFQVRAICPDETSAYSASTNFTTNDVSLDCGDDQEVTVSNIGETTATLSWLSMTNVNSYRYRYAPAGGGNTNGQTDETSVDLTGLDADTEYTFSLRVFCSTGGTSPVVTVTFTTGSGGGETCDVPDGLSATGITQTDATLNWNSVGTAVSYDYRYRVDGTATWTDGNTTSTSAALTGLTEGTTYEYQIQSVCSADASGYSASSTFITESVVATCDVPGGLSATDVTENSATLSWNAAGSALSYDYRYRVDGTTTWTDGNTTSTSAAISGLTASTTYEYQVQSVCDSESSGFSASSTFTTGDGGTLEDCDVGPQNVAASNITGSSATISWNEVDPTQINFHQYRYRTSSGGAWTTGTTSASSLDLTGLTSSTEYTFQMRNSCTTGGNSGVITVNFTTGASTSASTSAVIDGAQSLQYYPNPVRETLNIRGSEAKAMMVRIYNLNGALMKQIQVTRGSAAIDVHNLEKGMYLMEMVTDQKVEVKRFTKE